MKTRTKRERKAVVLVTMTVRPTDDCCPQAGQEMIFTDCSHGCHYDEDTTWLYRVGPIRTRLPAGQSFRRQCDRAIRAYTKKELPLLPRHRRQQHH